MVLEGSRAARAAVLKQAAPDSTQAAGGVASRDRFVIRFVGGDARQDETT